MTDHDTIDELQRHNTQREKSKVKISIFRRKTTRGQILKIFGPYLIKSDLRFHILKLVSKRKIQPQIALTKLLNVIRNKSGNNIYL